MHVHLTPILPLVLRRLFTQPYNAFQLCVLMCVFLCGLILAVLRVLHIYVDYCWNWVCMNFYFLNNLNNKFGCDASYRIALSEAFENAVVDQGDYTVDGAVLRQSSNGVSAVCADGETATYTIESLDDGANGEERVLLVQSDDQCAKRAADGDLTLVRLK